MACLFKARDRKYPRNYKQVTILPSFSRILVKIVKTQLQEYVISSELLLPEQYGFRKGLSTVYTIHSVKQAVHNSFNNRDSALGIVMDIQKAFDSLTDYQVQN